MSGKVEAKLKEFGIELPAATAPIANYVPFAVSGKLVVVSGQVSVRNGKAEFVGKLGREISVAEGQQAARLCALNILAHLKAACGGDLDRVKRCCGSAASSTARPSSPRCRRSSTAPPI